MPAVTVLGLALSITVSSEEAIRRVAVDVSPRVHFGNGTRQTQPTTGSILRVLVLVERPLRSAATKGPKGPWKGWRHQKMGGMHLMRGGGPDLRQIQGAWGVAVFGSPCFSVSFSLTQ